MEKESATKINKKTKIEQPKEREPAKKTMDQPSSETPKCPHYFGYLSNRSKSEPIPEECMTCEKLVLCMLKT